MNIEKKSTDPNYNVTLKAVCERVGTAVSNPLCAVKVKTTLENTCNGVTAETERVFFASGYKVGEVLETSLSEDGKTLIRSVVAEVTPVETKLELNYHGWPTCACEDNRDGTQTVYVIGSGNRYRHVDPFGETWLYRGIADATGRIVWDSHSVVNRNRDYRDLRDAGITALGDGQLIVTHFYHGTGLYLKEEEPSYVIWQQPRYLPSAVLEEIKAHWKTLSPEEDRPRSVVQYSNDGGKTWSEPQFVAVSAPHGVSVLSNGDLIYVGRRTDPTIIEKDGIYVIRGTVLRDADGKITDISWETLVELPYPNGYQPSRNMILGEPHAIELSNGRLLCAVRVNGVGYEEYPVPEAFGMATCYSDDLGKTWTPWELLDFTGAPPHLLELDNGSIVMTYCRRDKDRNRESGIYGEYARISEDGGVTWGEEIYLGDREARSGDLGYPSTVVLSRDNGIYELFTAYYGKHNGSTVNSFMYTTWQLNFKTK